MENAPPMRILFVDDDEVTLFLYRRLVKTRPGLEAHFARNGMEALDWIKESAQQFDLIFLDINMPVMDGYQFLQKHQALDKKKRARNIFVMLGTEITEEEKLAVSQIVESGFISKPLREDKFNAALAKALV